MDGDPSGAVASPGSTTVPTPNPFRQNRIALLNAFYPPTGSSYILSLQVVSVVYGIVFLLILVGFAGRVARKTFAVYRRENTVHGTYVSPDAGIVGECFRGLLPRNVTTVAQVYIWEHILVLRDHVSQLHAVVLQGLVWTPLFLAGWTTVRSIVIDATLAKYRHANSVPRWATPKFLQWISILVPVVVLIPTIITFIISSTKANTSFLTFLDITADLLVAESAFNGTLDEVASSDIVGREVVLAADTGVWKELKKVGIGMWFAGAIILLIILIPFTLLHLHLIHSQLKLLHPTATATVPRPAGIPNRPKGFGHGRSESTQHLTISHARDHSNSTTDTFDTDWDEAGKDKDSELARERAAFHAQDETEAARKALRKAFINIVLQLATLTLLVLSFGILGVVSAAAHLMGKTDETSSRVEMLASLWIYGTLGFAAQAFVVVRSFDRPTPLTRSTLSSNLEAVVGLGRGTAETRRAEREKERESQRKGLGSARGFGGQGVGKNDGEWAFPTERGF